MKLLKAALIATTTIFTSVSTASAVDDVIIVYDASGSMWGQIDGVSKIEIARDVMAEIIEGWSDKTNLGLVVYGHSSEGDCQDIETLIAPSPLDKTDFINTINGIRPKGKTPISAAIQHAADALSYRDNPASIVLISDGLETCQADPCAVAAELAQQGVSFTAHVIGFDLEDEAHEHLACIAQNTGGIFVPAQNANELKSALSQVQNIMDLQPVELAAAEPEIELEPKPDDNAYAEIDLSAPEQVTAGASFKVAWSASIDPQDYITIVPSGADEGTYNRYIRVRENSEDTLVAPSEAGLYELRYVQNKGSRTISSINIEVLAAETNVSAPEQVVTGADFKVTWTASIHSQDYITIVPAGVDEGTYTRYIRVRDNHEGVLIAPAETGLYEVRYVLQEGSRTLASVPVEVVSAEVGIAGPSIARAETPIRITWSASIHPQDYITIVPAGADEGVYKQYIRVRDKLQGDMKAPKDTGLYEVRYVLQEGSRTLASYPLEVIAADGALDGGAGLEVPDQADTNAVITVSWTGGSDSKDQRIALARADQADFSWISAHPVGDKKALDVKMPAESGDYEVRFLDVTKREILGRAIVKVK